MMGRWSGDLTRLLILEDGFDSCTTLSHGQRGGYASEALNLRRQGSIPWLFTLVVLTVLLLLLGCATQADAKAKSGEIFAGSLKYSHRTFADPVGTGGHEHNMFGNTSTNQGSTSATLRTHSALSTREPVDRSAAWVPDLSVGGVDVHPDQGPLYYRNTPGLDRHFVRPFAPSQEMIIKDDNGMVQWQCGKGKLQPNAPAKCNGTLQVRFTGPECWNQKGTKYTDLREATKTGCPKGFRRTPQLTWAPKYNLRGLKGKIMVEGGSGEMVPTSDMHADWMNGWLYNSGPSDFPSLIDRCIHKVPKAGPRPDFCRDPHKARKSVSSTTESAGRYERSNPGSIPGRQAYATVARLE